MGQYIDPTDGTTKEEWLEKNGEPILQDEAVMTHENYLPVCLVDNGAFTAAGISFDERQLNNMKYDGTERVKKWYLVEKGLLEPFCHKDLLYGRG
jgi:hypothetical protein